MPTQRYTTPALAHPDYLLEIEAVAVVGERGGGAETAGRRPREQRGGR